MVLVNGCKGIGTGFSTEVLCYNPLDIIQYIDLSLENKIAETESFEFLPFYNGFKGTIEKINDNKFIVKGKYEIVGTDVLRVTELPIGYWTEDFKELLEKLLDIDKKKEIAYINDYDDLSRDTTVDFTIYFNKGKLNELLSKVDENQLSGLDKLLKLYTYLSSNNMHLFNSKDKLHKYNNIKEIINEYVETRLEIYEKRKAYQLNSLNKELVLMTNKAKFINAILKDELDLRKKSKQEIIDILTKMEFDVIEDDKEYKYLIRMPMDSLTNENVEKINKEVGDKELEINKLEALTVKNIWKSELGTLSEKYQYFLLEKIRVDSTDTEIIKKKVKKVVKRVNNGNKIKIEK
jgi:DNA topoisomerase-2